MELKSPIVSVEWLNSHLDEEKLVVLDGTINKTQEFMGPQILKARFFDIKQKFSDITNPFPSAFPSEKQFQREARHLGIDHNSTIVVYDDKGIYSSARVWWLFRAFGFVNIAVLNGGLPAWQQAGFPTQAPRPYSGKMGDFKAQLQPGFMQFFKDVKKASKQHTHVILDARSSDRFNAKVPEPREGLRSGNIPNSKNLPYTALLDNGFLKAKTDIEPLFAPLAKKEAPVIFSCGSGITACILALGAEIIGYKNISVYDGSWTEWGSLSNG